MGVALSALINGKPLTTKDLSGKIFVVDTFNMLYQFLTTVRGPDGMPLTDDQGRVTGHLVGLFHRTTKLMQDGLKLAFVFDGKPPELKSAERERRKVIKQEAQTQFEAARDADDTVGMAKYAARTVRITQEIIDESKTLLLGLGLPVIQAPSEGEAQASYMVAQGDAWAVISQDFDCLLYGASRMVKNLTSSARRKKPRALTTIPVEPELLVLADVLTELAISREQLIALGMLIGTDFNIGGVKGLGPKKGLRFVLETPNLKELFEKVRWSDHCAVRWEEIFALFSDMPVEKEYDLTWKGVDREALYQLLVVEHNFSAERFSGVIDRLTKLGHDRVQKGLADFF